MLQVVSIKIFLMNFDFLFSRCHFRNPGHQYAITIIKNITKYLAMSYKNRTSGWLWARDSKQALGLDFIWTDICAKLRLLCLFFFDLFFNSVVACKHTFIMSPAGRRFSARGRPETSRGDFLRGSTSFSVIHPLQTSCRLPFPKAGFGLTRERRKARTEVLIMRTCSHSLVTYKEKCSHLGHQFATCIPKNFVRVVWAFCVPYHDVTKPVRGNIHVYKNQRKRKNNDRSLGNHTS